MEKSFKIRNEVIPFKDGYKKVKLVGKTGSGKTTILRQLLGTDLKNERFPAVSSGKTTVSTTEIILDNSNEYKLVATFLNEETVRDYVFDCCSRALYLYKYKKPKETDTKKLTKWKKDINRSLYQDSSEKFKLKLLFGSFDLKETDDSLEDICTSEEEKIDNLRKLEKLQSELFTFADELENDDENITEEDFNNSLYLNESFSSIINLFINQITEKMRILDDFNVEYKNVDEIDYCTYSSYDRKEFIKVAKILTGNSVSYHGRCLTPLVESIRIIGNFRPKWWDKNEEVPKLILVDGLGLSHETGNTDSISKDDKQFDKIIYVSKGIDAFAEEENYLKKFRLYGLTSKAHLVVTFFNQISGDDIQDDDDKVDKIQASLNQTLEGVSKELKDNGKSKEYLSKQLEDRTFYLGKINEEINTKDKNEYSEDVQLNALVDEILRDRTSVYENKYNQEVTVSYDINTITPYMDFLYDYEKKLLGKLGLDEELNFSVYNYTGSMYSYTSVRWMIHYISRDSSDGSSYFKPAKSLEESLRANIYSFLYNEIQIENDDDKEIVINDILNNFSEELYNLIKRIIIDDPLERWKEAKLIAGKGSSEKKARKVYKLLKEEIGENKQSIISNTIKLIIKTINNLFNI